MLFGFSLSHMPIHCCVLLAPLTLPRSLGPGIGDGWLGGSTEKIWSNVAT